MSTTIVKSKIKKTTSEYVMDIIIYTIFGIITFLCIYPFYYLIINTFSSNLLSSRGEILFYPQEIHFQNYIDIFQLKGMGTAAIVSVSRTAIGATCTVLASAFLGFMFTQEKMLGRKFAYRFLVVTMYFDAGLIPWYITMSNLGLTNNFLAYIIPAIVQPFNIILVKTYIESTPKALQEAAEIDGASILRIFAQIILPIAKPILATVAIFSAVGQWNSFQDTLILMTKDSLYSLQYILYTYMQQATSLATMMQNTTDSSSISAAATTAQTPTSIRMTVSVVVVIPILLVYPFFQRYFVKGVMIGSIKG